MSALPPKADMVQHDRDVRFVPKAEIRRCSKSTSLFDHLARDGDKESIGALARKAGKGLINRANRRGVDDLNLQSDCVGNFLHAVQRGLGAGNIRRIKEYGHANSLGHHVVQKS
jgi:hypothetical protein